MPTPSRRIVIAGATGFIGQHLHGALLDAGGEVVGGSRSPDAAQKRWPERSFVRLDVDEPSSLAGSLDGCDTAYFLVHGMADEGDYEVRERRSAESFLAACERAKVRRIVYLGGICPDGEPSKHLRSRLETGAILRSGRPSAIELRAAMVIGSGSASWQIVRDLASRLPVMVLPKWLRSQSEPVWMGDVVAALVAAGDDPTTESEWWDLPGPERLSARAVLERVARARGVAPRMVEVPLVTPRLSSYWIALVTRADARLAAELVEGLRRDIVADGSRTYWPRIDHELLDLDEAIRRALDEDEGQVPATSRAVEGLARRVTSRL